MTNPLARLFSSLANVVLDLGLPTIRGWLRDRLGPEADVSEVQTDGGTVTLEGVRIPLGPRGLIVLRRATATITSLTDMGETAPALRLHSFEGVLVFTRPELRDAFARTDDANAYVQNATFRADIAFTAGEDPDPAAWIWGDVEIKRALWTTETPGAPLTGRARLFVSSKEWRLEGARLDGAASSGDDGKPPAVARFAAAGTLERERPSAERPSSERASSERVSGVPSAPGVSGVPDAPAPLLPESIATVAFALEHGRIGPFLDAMTALAGEDVVRTRIPAAIPRDTQLDGELSWSAQDGARAELRLDAATIGARATVRAGCAPDGSGLNGRIDGNVSLAPLLRRLEAPSLAIPRDDDAVALVVTLRGHARAPEAQIDLRAATLGFRFGRPRYVPAVVLRDFAGRIDVEDGRATGRVTGANPSLAVDIEASRAGTNVAVAGELGAGFLRDVLTTLGGRAAIPTDASAAIALTVANGAPAGTVTLRTARSNLQLVLSPEPGASMRLAGGVSIADALATGLVENAALYPTRGELVVALDISRSDAGAGTAFFARGSVASAGELELKVGARELRYVVHGARADVALTPAALRYENLQFTGYGGSFRGDGDVSFTPRAAGAAPYLTLTLLEGGAPLARELFLLVPEPRPDIAIPESLRAVGKLVLGEDLIVHLSLTTEAGTELAVNVRSLRGNLHGSTARGNVALADALTIAKRAAPLAGLAQVDVDVDEPAAPAGGSAAGRTIRGVVASALVTYGDPAQPFALEKASAEVIVAPGGDVLWNRLDGRIADGRIISFGVARKGGEVLARVSAASVGVQELPPIEGRALGKYVRGRASGSVVGQLAPDGTIQARGDVVLDEAAFPVIDRVRPALARYGLRPPNEDATGPAVATLTIDARGTHLTDVAVDLHGASVRARVDMGPGASAAARTLDGHVEIILEEEYLRTSKLLTLPRVLGDRLVIPIAVKGTLAEPDVHAELGQSLGQFLRETKVGDFITSAVEEAQLFFTSSKRKTMTPPVPPAPTPSVTPAHEADLRKQIDAHAAAWAALGARRK